MKTYLMLLGPRERKPYMTMISCSRHGKCRITAYGSFTGAFWPLVYSPCSLVIGYCLSSKLWITTQAAWGLMYSHKFKNACRRWAECELHVRFTYALFAKKPTFHALNRSKVLKARQTRRHSSSFRLFSNLPCRFIASAFRVCKSGSSHSVQQLFEIVVQNKPIKDNPLR